MVVAAGAWTRVIAAARRGVKKGHGAGAASNAHRAPD
jgi:hypothetical protein